MNLCKNRIYKVKKILTNINMHFKAIATFPHFWIEIIISLLASLSMIASIRLYNNGKEFLSSISANIFAGLLTGFILLLITGLKTKNRYKVIKRCEWFQELHNQIRLFWVEESELLKRLTKGSDQDFYDKAYDTVCSGNDINCMIMNHPKDYVTSINFEKILAKNFGYNALDVSNKCGEIREYIMYSVDDKDYRKNVINKINKYRREINKLNTKILKEIEICKYKLHLIDKSIL